MVRQLALRTALPANWTAGLAEAERQGVFVAPAVDGWVFAVGADLRPAPGAEHDRLAPLLESLSRTFGRAAWFAAHDDAEVHGWMLAERGRLRRAYAFAGEHGHTLWLGEVTDDERRLGCFVDDPRDGSDDEVKWWPDSRIVLQHAAAWTLDPRRLGTGAARPGHGWVGRC